MKSLFALYLIVLFHLSGDIHASVLRIENELRYDVLGGQKFGNAGTYEWIGGDIIFGLNPQNIFNQNICDLHLAPIDPGGNIILKSKLIVLQPKDPSKRNGIALVEVSNRGGIALMRMYNGATTGQVRPNVPVDYGNGFLLKQGFTIVWIGWQWDVPDLTNSLKLEVPVVKNEDGSTITGLVRTDWVIDENIDYLSLGHRNMIPYRAANFYSPINKLTSRPNWLSHKATIPPTIWSFSNLNNNENEPDSGHIHLEGGFKKGSIYELVYLAKDPVLAGGGLAAIRDIASYIKYDPACSFRAKKTVAQGVSQTGRFLREFLYDGFNTDENGRSVYDGLLIYMAGAGRGSFNHRFAQPSRDGHRYSSFDFPIDLFPFSTHNSIDEESGQSDKLNRNDDSCKLFFINTGYEYWGRGASLIHTFPDGLQDILPSENERYFHMASMQHYTEAMPDSADRIYQQYDLFKGNPNFPAPSFKALLIQMKEWLIENRLPIDSKIPSISQHTLIRAQSYSLPYIPGLDNPVGPYAPARLYFGPRWSEEKIIDQEPPLKENPFTVLVPAVDKFGNEIGGIRSIEIRVPLATYTPWSLRDYKMNFRELDDFRGLFIPLPKQTQNKTTRDMRPTLNGLYIDKKDYLQKIDADLAILVAERLLLQEDVPILHKRSENLWEWVQRFRE